MERIRLGATGMAVTKIGLGGIPLQRLSFDRAVELVAHAFRSGINWVDTAHGYGFSEEVIGRALTRFKRADIFIFSKAMAVTKSDMESLTTTSFARLGVEYIDLYQFHQVKNADHWKQIRAQGARDYLCELKAQGRVRHIGASAHSKDGALAVLEDPLIEVLQYPCSFLVEEDCREIRALCREKNVGFIAMKPMGGGMIQDGALAVRFLLQLRDVVLDPGFESREEIDELIAVAATSRPLSAAEEERIAVVRRELGKVFCHRCGYCQPCPEGVETEMLMVLDSMLKRFPAERFFTGHLLKVNESLAQCSECGVCETRCPYELPIRQRMRQNHAAWLTLKSASAPRAN